MHQRLTFPQAEAAREKRNRRIALAGMFLAMTIFGSNFVVSRHAILNGLTSHDLLALRFGTAGLILLPTFLSGGIATCGGLGWRRGVLLAIMSGLPMSYLLLTGLSFAPAAHGAAIGPGLVTMIGVVGGVFLFGTALTPQLFIGIGVVIAGLACLAIAGTTHTNPTILLGDLCFLGVGLIWGAYPLMIQRWKVDALRATAVVSVLSLIYLPLYGLVYFRGFDIAPWWVLALHGLNQGVFNIILGLVIWSWSTRVLGPAVVGRFPPLIPVVGTLLAIPVLGEIPGTLQITGVGLIICGLFAASWRRPPELARRSHQGEVPADAEDETEPKRDP